ncbi:pilus assembly protein [Stappia taiwanensis]|uniref:Pilus assembly protein n=1 Tax=Stappia taiwanensis TaxID=992267 RepID=A0A838XWA3_9HYPH|nr:TadE/TadG family type IV pilus assembly protein [Stappia taiwanensis]MBA4612776.1 pilus assembly protein [Stappia taiwanensis]GGE90156.1 hypothetical protein GCM10007285_16990 [Stappia taiwanensis]
MGARQQIGRIVARFADNRQGVAAVEFALVLPFMVLLFIGMLELNNALTLDRKVSQASSAVADLVAQADKLSSGEIADILKMGDVILSPYPGTDLKLVVASIWIKDVDKPQVVWSRASNTGAWASGGAPPIPLPAELTKTKNTYLIVATTEYAFTPMFSGLVKDIFGTGTITLGDTYYLRPRISTNVTCCS